MEANYKFQTLSIPRKVFNTDTGALTRGYALVYDPVSTNEAAVTVEDLARGKYVVNPTASKDLYFAGVLPCSKASTLGANFVEVVEPGSDALIYISEAVTAGDIVYFNAGGTLQGQFSKGGIGLGCGAAVVHTTITEAGYAHATLLKGDNAGGVQLLAPTAGGALTGISLNGTTIIDGDDTGVTANLTYTLADGTYVGQKKKFTISTLINGTNDLVVTVTTGVQQDGTTALATVTLDEAGDTATLEWIGSAWRLTDNTGGALA